MKIIKKRDMLIWLNNIEGINNRNISKIIDCFHDIRELWDLSYSRIEKLPIGKRAKINMKKNMNIDYLNQVKENAYKKEINIMTSFDKEYPIRLKNTPDPPYVLYIKGRLKENDVNSISVVGTRKPTPYGIYAVEKLVSELSEYGITVVSGMASGIDTYAHLTSLKENNRTIAVLGTGVDTIYPSHNTNLYHKIIENGAVISEFPLGTKGLPYNFPQRNRIISGLSLGTLVIEAEERSGTLITVSHCLEQGREVFAVPGCINSSFSKGTNNLIRDGAKLVDNAIDIVEELRELRNIDRICNDIPDKFNKLGDDEMKVLNIIKKSPADIDQIARVSGMDISKLSGIITVLEIKGNIKRTGGNILCV